MKRALILSGGGSKGAFEVGALNYLIKERKTDFHIFMGTSVGALNAAILAQAQNFTQLAHFLDKLNSIWLQIRNSGDIYQNGIRLLNILFSNSLYKPRGLRRLIRCSIDVDKLFNSGRLLMITTVAAEDGELRYATNRDPSYKRDILKYILASASIPLIFPPVEIDGKNWMDGGVRDITPLGTIFDERPDEIVIITTTRLNRKLEPVYDYVPLRGAFSIVNRAISIITSEIGANDIQRAHFINENHSRFFPLKRKIPIKLIFPCRGLADNKTMNFNPNLIRENIKLGYECAKNSYYLL